MRRLEQEAHAAEILRLRRYACPHLRRNRRGLHEGPRRKILPDGDGCISGDHPYEGGEEDPNVLYLFAAVLVLFLSRTRLSSRLRTNSRPDVEAICPKWSIRGNVSVKWGKMIVKKGYSIGLLQYNCRGYTRTPPRVAVKRGDPCAPSCATAPLTPTTCRKEKTNTWACSACSAWAKGVLVLPARQN